MLEKPSRVVYTLGYWGRDPNDFMGLLRLLRVELVVDIRRWPSSRYSSFYNKDVLEKSLGEVGVGYVWLGEELGGYRRLGVDVIDDGSARCFKSMGFTAYAQYMLNSPKAREALARLEEEVKKKKTVIICREARPWACHRKLVSDWLLHRGLKVVHVLDPGLYVEHKLTKCARISKEGALSYA